MGRGVETVDYIAVTLIILLGAGLAWIVLNALNNDKHPPSR